MWLTSSSHLKCNVSVVLGTSLNLAITSFNEPESALMLALHQLVQFTLVKFLLILSDLKPDSVMLRTVDEGVSLRGKELYFLQSSKGHFLLN